MMVELDDELPGEESPKPELAVLSSGDDVKVVDEDRSDLAFVSVDYFPERVGVELLVGVDGKTTYEPIIIAADDLGLLVVEGEAERQSLVREDIDESELAQIVEVDVPGGEGVVVVVAADGQIENGPYLGLGVDGGVESVEVGPVDLALVRGHHQLLRLHDQVQRGDHSLQGALVDQLEVFLAGLDYLLDFAISRAHDQLILRDEEETGDGVGAHGNGGLEDLIGNVEDTDLSCTGA